jgi:hypothetical protein
MPDETEIVFRTANGGKVHCTSKQIGPARGEQIVGVIGAWGYFTVTPVRYKFGSGIKMDVAELRDWKGRYIRQIALRNAGEHECRRIMLEYLAVYEYAWHDDLPLQISSTGS